MQRQLLDVQAELKRRGAPAWLHSLADSGCELYTAETVIQERPPLGKPMFGPVIGGPVSAPVAYSADDAYFSDPVGPPLPYGVSLDEVVEFVRESGVAFDDAIKTLSGGRKPVNYEQDRTYVAPEHRPSGWLEQPVVDRISNWIRDHQPISFDEAKAIILKQFEAER